MVEPAIKPWTEIGAAARVENCQDALKTALRPWGEGHPGKEKGSFTRALTQRDSEP
jgi:hypothetical protein